MIQFLPSLTRTSAFLGLMTLSGVLHLIPFNGSAQTSYEITTRMFETARQIKSAKYTLKKIERINGLAIEEVNEVKLNASPFQVYFKQITPTPGLEVLYNSQTHPLKAVINPNGFPWVNLNLDTQGNLMRKEQHHTILEAGFEYLTSVSEHIFTKYADQIHEMLQPPVVKHWRGSPCWVIEIRNDKFGFVEYRVQAGETLAGIANKFKISDFMIVEKNVSVKNFGDILTGQIITIPNDYAAKIVLYINQNTYAPVVMKVFDHEGLFEHYEYQDLIIDPAWEPEEFERTFEAYNF